MLVKKYLKEQYNKKAFVVSAMVTLLATIPIIFTSSFKIFIIYNVVFNITYKITQILVDTAVFNIHSNKTIKKYYLEYTYLSESIHATGKAISELMLLIAVIISYNLNTLRIIAAVLSFSIVLQMVIYTKFCENKEQLE